MSKYYEKLIVQKLKQDIINHFSNDKEIKEIIDDYFETYKLNLITESVKYDIKENNTNVYRDRSLYDGRKNRCIARVWNCGMGGQCSRANMKDGFCKMHYEKGGHQWWLGTINERKPYNPINHNGKVHQWLN
tara:strand:- start:81 stop:476 length:396 start_codon:yes stop_codon:yes gene_type:complete